MPDSPSNDKRPVEIDDLYRIRLVADPQASPDGNSVAYVQTRLRKKSNDYASNIWLVPADGSAEPRKFTGSSKRDMSPRWSPDGQSIAFLSTRSGKPQIWAISTAGGEARQVTRHKHGVSELAWSPDGRWFAFSAAVDSDLDRQIAEDEKKRKTEPTDADSENREPGQGGEEGLRVGVLPAGEWDEDEEDEKSAEDKGDHAQVITRVHIKGEGIGLLLRRSHIFVVKASGGKPQQITEGDWDAASPRWSPDGQSIAFLASQGEEAELHNIQDIYVVPFNSDGTIGETRQVTRHDSSISAFDWAPLGDDFIVLGHSRTDEGALGTNLEVRRISLDGEITSLTASLDRPVGSWVNSDLWAGTGELRPRFSRDGSTIYFMLTTEGKVHVYSVPLTGGEVRPVVEGRRTVLNFAVTNSGIAFTAATSGHPCDLFARDPQSGEERQLTGANADLQADISIGEARELRVDGPAGQVHGWMLMPPGFDESKRYPLILQIHGGPHVSYGEAYLHEFQILASRGYIVLYTNPRGSQGYGQEFSDAILNDWGGVDYDDLMAVVDYVAALPYVDANRLGVAGGSYGGYMTTWMVGHTQRFRAAVAMRAVTNLYSAWGSGDYTWALWSWEMGGMPQERTELYLERSPVTYAKEIHTPLLLTHAEDDFRVDIEQSHELYMALKVLKRTVKMVRFPSGGHDISRSGKPSLRIERLQHIADWFDQYMGGTEE